MAVSGDPKTSFLRRHRRIWIVLGVFALIAAAGWALAERYLLDMERNKELLVEFLAERIGVEADLDELEVALLPTPRAIVRGATLRTPQASATVAQVAARFNLARLFQREVRISGIEVSGLDVRIAEDVNAIPDLIEGIESTWKETRTREPGISPVDVALDRIGASNVQVRFGDRDEGFAALDIEIDDVLSDHIAVRVVGPVQGAGKAARIDGEVVVILNREADAWQIAGNVDVIGVQTDRLPYDNAPQGVLDAHLKLTPGEGQVAARLRATLKSDQHPALTGDLESDAIWTGQAFRVPRATWKAAGAVVEAFGEFESADAWRAHVTQARMTEGVLDALLAMAEQPRVKFEAEPGGYIDVKDVDVGPTQDGPVRLASGSAEFTALAVVPKGKDNQDRAARGIRGSLRVAENVITIPEIRTDAARVSGTIAPNFEDGSARIDLGVTADLGRLPWEAFDALASVQRLDGHLTVTELAGTFTDDGGLPGDFVLNADLTGGAAIYSDEDIQLDVRTITGTFVSSGNEIQTTLDGEMSGRTPFNVSGSYDIEARQWSGVLRADVGDVGPTIFADTDLGETVRPVAETLGKSEFDIQVALPAADRDTASIKVSRRGDQALSVLTAFDDAGGLRSVSGSGTLPVDTMVTEYFPRLSGSGFAGFAVDYRPVDGQLSATLDLTACAVKSYSIVQKSRGLPMVGRLELDLGDTASLRSLAVEVDNVPAIATTDKAVNGIIPLEIDLPLLAPVLVDGASAGGTIFVRYDSNARATELRFDKVSIAIDDRLALDRVQGPLQIFQDSIATDGLEIHGARSDCKLRIAKVGDAWTGGLEGRSFNVHAVTELLEAVTDLLPAHDDEDSDVASFWDRPLLGEFTVDLGSVYYNRGHLDDVKFRVLGEDRALRVRDIAVTPYAGGVTATLAVVPAEDADARLKLTVNATDFDARTLNDFVWANDQGLYGAFTGTVTFDAPLGDVRHMLATGDGAITFNGVDGSLGQTSFATKLLTALKTTDILNLRLHSLRDKGVTFQTWGLDLRMDDGIVNVQTFNLDGGGYAMLGQGEVNFANEDTNVVIQVMPLESVSKVIKRVPILGDLAAAVSTDLVGVPLKLSGSPYDLKVSVAKELAKNILTTPLRAGQGALKSVTGGESSDNGSKTPENKKTISEAPPKDPRTP